MTHATKKPKRKEKTENEKEESQKQQARGGHGQVEGAMQKGHVGISHVLFARFQAARIQGR